MNFTQQMLSWVAGGSRLGESPLMIADDMSTLHSGRR